MTRKHLYISILTTVIALSVNAQKRFDIFYLAGNYNFVPTKENSIGSNYENAILANISLPIVLKNSSVWFTSINYQRYDVSNNLLSNATSIGIDKFNMHGIIIRTGYIYKLNKTQSLQILFVPRHMSDLNVSYSKSLQLGGIVMYEKIKSEDLTWRAGVLFNEEKFGMYIVPLLYLDWNMTTKIKVKGLLPIYCKVFVEPAEKLSTGIHFFGLTTSYTIQGPNQDLYYVDRRRIDLSLFTNYNVWDNFFLEARAGYSLSRDYRLYADGDKLDIAFPLIDIGNERNRFNEKEKGNPFVQLRMIYSVPID